MHDLLTNEGLV